MVRVAVAPRCSGVRHLFAIGLLVAGVTAARAQPAPPSPRADRPLSLLADGVLDLRWATPPDVVLAAAPAFDTTTAYVATRDGAVAALDLESGAVRWRVDATTTMPLEVGGDLVYVVMADGVRALQAASGATAWQRPLEGTIAAPPFWDTGWLMLSFDSGDLAALRAADGAPVWRVALGAVAQVPPASALDNIYLGLADGRTVALKLASGQTLWSVTLDGRASGLAALDEQLLVGTTSGIVHSVDLRSGRSRWRVRIGAGIVAAPVADASRVYVVAYDHVLRALDRKRGHLRWKRALPHRPADGPQFAAGTVVVPVYATEIQGFDAATGTPTLTLTSTGEVAGATRPRVGGGATGTRLTAVSIDGQLLAFGPRIEAAPVPLGDLPGLAVPEPPDPAQPPPSGGADR